MTAIGRFLNVPVIDHLIISEKDYFSFSDSGLLEEIISESTYDLSFSNIEKLKKKAEKSKVDTKREIAKKSLEEGLSVELVMKLTGLTKKEVEKLNGKK